MTPPSSFTLYISFYLHQDTLPSNHALQTTLTLSYPLISVCIFCLPILHFVHIHLICHFSFSHHTCTHHTHVSIHPPTHVHTLNLLPRFPQIVRASVGGNVLFEGPFDSQMAPQVCGTFYVAQIGCVRALYLTHTHTHTLSFGELAHVHAHAHTGETARCALT